MNNAKKKIVAVLSDLIFTVKIQEAAKRAGLEVTFVSSKEKALAQAQDKPAAMILDLNDSRVNALELIGTLKGDPGTSGIELVGYVSHVQVDLKQAALDKGCDLVVARSAFSQNLPSILNRYLVSANE